MHLSEGRGPRASHGCGGGTVVLRRVSTLDARAFGTHSAHRFGECSHTPRSFTRLCNILLEIGVFLLVCSVLANGLRVLLRSFEICSFAGEITTEGARCARGFSEKHAKEASFGSIPTFGRRFGCFLPACEHADEPVFGRIIEAFDTLFHKNHVSPASGRTGPRALAVTAAPHPPEPL